jgi:hypothetical protein
MVSLSDPIGGFSGKSGVSLSNYLMHRTPSRKWLSKEHCSGIARFHFDQIHKLKDLISAGSLPTETPLDVSAAIKEWLPRVMQVLKGSVVNRIENPLFYRFCQRIRQVRDDLPGLIFAI